MYLGLGVPRFIVVQDFVVDAALELGILRVSWAQSALRAVERWAFRSAHVLSTISPEMEKKLRQRVGSDREVRYIPNWIHTSLELEVRRQWASGTAGGCGSDRCSLFYSGNLGVKQGLPEFIGDFAVASAGWTLRVHGGGAERHRVEALAKGDAAFEFGDVGDEASYVANLLRSTACLITQKPGVSANFLPSKLLPALVTGTPVLAVCEADSPLGREVENGGFGEVITPGDRAALAGVLSRWADDAANLKRLSSNAQRRSARYLARSVLPRLEEAARSVAGGAGSGVIDGAGSGTLPARRNASADVGGVKGCQPR
jgi:colanic acid biosynthesis glycosyl transferase WcaI